MRKKIIPVEIINTTPYIMKNIKARIEPQFPFSSDENKYIQTLEPKKSTLLHFGVDIDSGLILGRYTLNILLEFEDAQGKKQTDILMTPIVIKNKNIVRTVFLDCWHIWVLFVVMLFIIVGSNSSKHTELLEALLELQKAQKKIKDEAAEIVYIEHKNFGLTIITKIRSTYCSLTH